MCLRNFKTLMFKPQKKELLFLKQAIKQYALHNLILKYIDISMYYICNFIYISKYRKKTERIYLRILTGVTTVVSKWWDFRWLYFVPLYFVFFHSLFFFFAFMSFLNFMQWIKDCYILYIRAYFQWGFKILVVLILFPPSFWILCKESLVCTSWYYLPSLCLPAGSTQLCMFVFLLSVHTGLSTAHILGWLTLEWLTVNQN